MVASLKFNHDVVVPKGRIPELFALVDGIKSEYRLRIPCFGHAGDGNIHVNIMVDAERRGRDRARARGRRACSSRAWSRSKGSISGEHGIGFSKAPYLPLELSAEEIALMKRVKLAFDPDGILNPGKIFPLSIWYNRSCTMLLKLPLIGLLALLSLSPPQSQADEIAALKRQLQELKTQQSAMERDLQAIKAILQEAQGQARRSVRQQVDRACQRAEPGQCLRQDHARRGLGLSLPVLPPPDAADLAPGPDRTTSTPAR